MSARDLAKAIAASPKAETGLPTGTDLTFRAPWEARIFALVVVMVERGAITWREFQEQLVAEITKVESGQATVADDPGEDGADPQSADQHVYYSCWTRTAEDVLRRHGLVSAGDVERHMDHLQNSLEEIRRSQLNHAGPVHEGH